MKLPSNLYIGAYKVPVTVNCDLQAYGQFIEGPIPSIEVGELTKNSSQTASTLLHESLHAISAFYGLKFSELTVRVLEQALCCLFRDNPQFAKGLLEDLQKYHG